MENLSNLNPKPSKISKGEVWTAYDEKSQKVRPFLIVSEELTGVDIDISVAPTTTHEKRNIFDITIEFWKDAGLSQPSVARCSKIHYINHMLLRRKLGTLDSRDLANVNDAMRKYLGL